jgi:DNA repair protein RecN (Recombination protein N)
MSHLYLSRLTLKNFVTFEEENIQFHPHFNAIVGETGSGKSLILSALNLVLGGRSDRKLIRKDCDFSYVEAEFSGIQSEIDDHLNSMGYPFEGSIILKRVIYQNGQNKNFLNFQNCSLNDIKSFSKRFIDIVGQFENQKLLSPNYQLKLLDLFNEDSIKIKSEYERTFKISHDLNEQLEDLDNKGSEERLDYVRFQVDTFQNLSPSVQDENALEEEKERFQSFEEDQQLRNNLHQCLNGSDTTTGLITQLDEFRTVIEKSKFIEEGLAEETLCQVDLIKDTLFEISKYEEQEFDEVRYNEILDRLHLYGQLKRKFRTTTEGLVEQFNEFQEELEQIENYHQIVSELKEKISTLNEDLWKKASLLSEKRQLGSKQFSHLLTQAVRELKMDNATVLFEVSEKDSLDSNGCNEVVIKAETNRGEGLHPINKAASGGELSRILLALRHLLASKDSISVFLFDEIDTGLGGETAFRIGEKLKAISETSQVISITHLPQIAQFSDVLLQVGKETQNERTRSKVNSVAVPARKKFLKEMTGLQLN